jgi:hypothetical protein
MSITYDIVCHECKKRRWIGQGSFIYSTPKYMERLSEFLHEHINHPLEFMRDEQSSHTGYDEVVWDDED